MITYCILWILGELPDTDWAWSVDCNGCFVKLHFTDWAQSVWSQCFKNKENMQTQITYTKTDKKYTLITHMHIFYYQNYHSWYKGTHCAQIVLLYTIRPRGPCSDITKALHPYLSFASCRQLDHACTLSRFSLTPSIHLIRWLPTGTIFIGHLWPSPLTHLTIFPTHISRLAL